MSLINDALKRAKQAQQENPESPAPVPPLRPVEQSQLSARNSLGIILPIGLALVALLGLMLLWILWKKEGAGTTTQPLTAAARVPAAQPAPAAVETPTPPATRITAESTPGIGNHPENTTVNSASTNAAVSNISSQTDTNQVPAVEPTPPTPAPLRLQSIVYNPRTPSAMINGRVLFVGDRIRDVRVTAIHRGDVVLIGGGRTNVLSLEP